MTFQYNNIKYCILIQLLAPHNKKSNMQKDSTQQSAVKVFIRVRPMVSIESGSKQVVSVQQDNRTVDITSDALSVLQTKFDYAFNKQRTQIQIFQQFVPSICKIPQGYNMTVFAYGQTGSGKTYTMFGSDWEQLISKDLNTKRQNTFLQDLSADQNFAGLIPRTIFKLFQQIKIAQQNQPKFRIYCSFLQIYNEKIYDLLQDFPKPKALNLHQSKLDGIFVQGLAQFAVTHYSDCLQLMKRGQKNRFIRQTSMNAKSSRSHTIFQILLQSIHPDNRGMFKKARLNLCDLAGSQKVNKSQAMGQEHFKQLKNINQSLTTLGKVIYSLSSGGKSIPSFRQSKLTRLLQDSLTANTFTFIVGNISPSSNNMDETMNTLKFVQRARHIVMKVKPMQFNGQNMEIVNKLQKQIQYLKELLNLKRKGMSPDDIHSKLVNLQQQNQKLKKTSVSIQDVQRLIEENRQMKMQIHKLQMSQYAQSDGDNKSEASMQSSNRFNHSQSVSQKMNKNIVTSGFQLPSNSQTQSPRNKSSGNITTSSAKYTPTQTQTSNSLVRVGKLLVQNDTSFDSPTQNGKTERKKQKQKILQKLEQLQRIQKFNEQKLLKDLQQLQKKNKQTRSTAVVSSVKKKTFGTPVTTGEKRPAVNYQDKIKELEAKLFGR